MGFIKNLGKGFIRSAINQVGRDAGRVMSNNLYGDAHATPYRNVSGDQMGEINEEDILIKFFDKAPESYSSIAIKVIIAYLFNVLGGIVLIVYGFYKKKKAHLKTVEKYLFFPVYENDFYTGERKVARHIPRKISTKEDEANEEQIAENIKKANIYIYAGVVAIIGGAFLWYAFGGK